MKKLSYLIALSFFMLFGAIPVQAQNLPDTGLRHQVFQLSLQAGEPEVIESPFFFQAIAVNEVEGVAVQFLQDGQWSDWQGLSYEEESLSGSELSFVKTSESFALRADRDLEVEVIVMDLLTQSRRVASLNPVGFDSPTAYLPDPSDLKVISRREWGADEVLRTYDPNALDDEDEEEDSSPPKNVCKPIEQAYPGQYQLDDKVVYFDELGRNLIWPQQYSRQIKKIVIHHTAQTLKDLNDDGRIDSRDYRLSIQAIYTYHTVSRGWGDLGYHFLVDPDGNIYEGKAGGLGVIGAHVLCQNSNTIGIAVMGNYEEGRLSTGAFEGLVGITKYLTDLYRINPKGESSFRGSILPHIVTHAEVGAVTKSFIGQGATQCPGAFLKRDMSRLRQVVADGGIRPEYRSEVVGLPRALRVDPLQDFDVSFQLKNTGERAWNQIQLREGREIIKDISSVSVSSGSSLPVRLDLQSDFDAGRRQKNLQIYANGQRLPQEVSFSYSVNRPEYRYDVVSVEGASGSLLVGQTDEVKMTLKNTSNFPWFNEGRDQVQIQEVMKRGNQVTVSTRGMSLFLPQKVAVGESVTISFDLPQLRRPGEIRYELIPVLGRNKGFRGPSLVIERQVEEPRFEAEILVDRRTRLRKGYEDEVEFELVNKGNFEWKNQSVKIQILSPKSSSSPSAEGSSLRVEDKSSLEFSNHQAVQTGESTLFSLPVYAGYDDREVLVKGMIQLMDLPPDLNDRRLLRASNQRFEIPLKASGRILLSAEFVGQSEAKLPSAAGEYEAWVDLKNTGSVPWYQQGADRIVLRAQDSPDFFSRGWERPNNAGFLEKVVVLPGETGRFKLILQHRGEQRNTVSDTFVPVVGDRKLRLRGMVRFELEGKLPERRERIRKLPNEEVSDEEVSRDDTLAIPPMRVWLTELDQDLIEVSSPGAFILWDSKTTKVRTLAANEIFRVSADQVQDGTVFRLRAVESDYLEFQNWDRVRAFGNNVNDNKFREVLEFRPFSRPLSPDNGGGSPLSRGESENPSSGMIAINELSLENYMKGIAEVPETDDQPQEKRKTIAVLARSYALHYLIGGYEKFPGKPYNAADSPAIFQKYNGYNFELRSPKWQKALEETRGEVVMVDGQWSIDNGLSTGGGAERVLRAAYFSCTDGERTKSWNEVWSGNEYFQRFGAVFQSVADPLGDDPNREGSLACGHQVGLSGYGATQMTRGGATYKEVIQHYYQGVEVSIFP